MVARSVILAILELRQEGDGLKASLGYPVRPYLMFTYVYHEF